MDKNLRDYYEKTAAEYDQLHSYEAHVEHARAISTAVEQIDRGSVTSALDIGCGTGLSLNHLKSCLTTAGSAAPSLNGVDMTPGLIDRARERLPEADLQVCDGAELPFDDGSFDLVMIAGVLHHVPAPKRVISEAFRVSAKYILISDHNKYAFGGNITKRVRMILFCLGLLNIFTYIKQGFNKQGYSEDDGWWYPYSVLDDYDIISENTSDLLIYPTRPPVKKSIKNMIYAQSHLAFLCKK